MTSAASSLDSATSRAAALRAVVAALVEDATTRAGLAGQRGVAIVVVPAALAHDAARRALAALDQFDDGLASSDGARALATAARHEMSDGAEAWVLLCGTPLQGDERARLVALSTCAAALKMAAPRWGLTAKLWSCASLVGGALGEVLVRDVGTWFADAEVVAAVALRTSDAPSAGAPPTAIAPSNGVPLRWLGESDRLDLPSAECVERARAEVPPSLRAADGARAIVCDPSLQSVALIAALEGAGYYVERREARDAMAAGAQLVVFSLDAAESRGVLLACADLAAPAAGPAVLAVTRFGHDDVRLAAARAGAFFLRLPARPSEIARTAFELAAARRRVDQVRVQTEELRNAQAELVRSERMATLGWLAASVGHDLRTPLAAIRSNSELALKAIERIERDPSLSQPIGRTIKTLADLERTNLQAVDRLADIVKALKAVARPGEDAPGTIDVSVREVLTQVLALCAHELLSLRVDAVLSEPSPRVAVGHAELMQVVMNLVVNAAHAIGAAGGRIEVRAEPGADASTVLLTVTDDGPGIDPAVMPRLFRAGVTTRAAQGGTGLGLSIVKRIVDRYGGSIEVKSEPGHGARFCVTLPAAGAAPGRDPSC